MGTGGGALGVAAVNGWEGYVVCPAEFPLDPIGRFVLYTYAQNPRTSAPIE
jgi:hypothetical protein